MAIQTRKRRTSIKARTIIGLACSQAIILGLLIYSSTRVLEDSHSSELDRRAMTTARLISTSAENAVISGDLATLDALAKEVCAMKQISYVKIVGKEGWTIAQGNPKTLAAERRVDHSIRDVTDGVFDASTDIVVGGRFYARVLVGTDIGPVSDALVEARNRSLSIATLAIIAALIAAGIFWRYLAQRLRELSAMTACIADGQYGVTIESEKNDEIGDTVLAFNSMSVALQNTDQQRRVAEEEIIRLNVDLEQRVQTRTAELAALNRELEYRAMHDSLTDMPNRMLFTDRLDQAIRRAARDQSCFSVLTLDLDRFKWVNDSMGHQLGDLVLQTAAQRIRRCLRDSDTAARMGGDEFAVLLPTASTPDGAIEVATKIARLVSEPMMIGTRQVDIGASIGIAIFPIHASDLATLMKRSDAAMYEAKRSGSSWAVYTAACDQHHVEPIASKRELLDALEGNEFILHYQPKLDLSTGAVQGVEALVRWAHPAKGIIYPDKFIADIEQYGIVRQFTAKIVEMALAQVKTWEAAGVNLNVAVNISTLNLQDACFPQDIREVIEASGVEPSRLDLEVTETAIMTEPARAIENIRLLSEMGVTTSIDDFGIGYSSMSYLKRLAVSTMKIDRSFVMDMSKDKHDFVIVKSAIDLGHNLDMKVVAEGVENINTWEQLRELGCDIAQGYYMSKPLPADKVIEWVKGATFNSALTTHASQQLTSNHRKNVETSSG